MSTPMLPRAGAGGSRAHVDLQGAIGSTNGTNILRRREA
jgi:hypothetical protein